MIDTQNMNKFNDAIFVIKDVLAPTLNLIYQPIILN